MHSFNPKEKRAIQNLAGPINPIQFSIHHRPKKQQQQQKNQPKTNKKEMESDNL